MRREIVVILLLCMSTLAMVAQPRLRQPEMYVGVHGGVMAASVNFSPMVGNMSPITQSVVLGGTGGIAWRYSIQKCCALQIELDYMLRGWRENNQPEAYTRRLHYLELPLLMHIYFGKEHFRGFFNLGPQIGYCVYDDGGHGTKQDAYRHQYADITPFDWGVAGGIGFYGRTTRAGIYQLEARFSYGLGGVFGTQLVDHFNMASPMNLSVHLGWMYEVKPRHRKEVKP